MAEVIPAISSSACKVLTPKFLYVLKYCRISVAGVIGYDQRNNGRPLLTDAVRNPRAVASLPDILL